MQESITQFCVLAYDEMHIENKYKEKAEKIKEDIAASKQALQDFASKQGQTCIPLKITVDGEEQKLFLRFIEKITSKSININAFKNVVQNIPKVSELQDIFTQLQNPEATLGEVYATWLYNELYKQNTTKKETFEISKSNERTKKGINKQVSIHIPESILQKATEYSKLQHGLQHLKSLKSEKIQKIEEQKKEVEPTIAAHFETRPMERQVQKVSMEIDGETKPWFIKRVVKETKPSSISLSKVKPIIFNVMDNVISSKLTFDSKTVEEFFRLNNDIQNNIFLKFCSSMEHFKESHSKMSSTIELTDKEGRAHRPKRKSSNDSE
jgi:hypothetical protein